MGRKTKLTPELIERICSHIRKGLNIEQATYLSGIGQTSYFEWVKKGGQPKTAKIYALFLKSTKEAQADFETANLEIIRQAAMNEAEVKTVIKVIDGDREVITTKIEKRPKVWTAAAWLLERKFPDRYGRRVIEHAGKVDTGNVPQVVMVFDDGVSEVADEKPES